MFYNNMISEDLEDQYFAVNILGMTIKDNSMYKNKLVEYTDIFDNISNTAKLRISSYCEDIFTFKLFFGKYYDIISGINNASCINKKEYYFQLKLDSEEGIIKAKEIEFNLNYTEKNRNYIFLHYLCKNKVDILKFMTSILNFSITSLENFLSVVFTKNLSPKDIKEKYINVDIIEDIPLTIVDDSTLEFLCELYENTLDKHNIEKSIKNNLKDSKYKNTGENGEKYCEDYDEDENTTEDELDMYVERYRKKFIEYENTIYDEEYYSD